MSAEEAEKIDIYTTLQCFSFCSEWQCFGTLACSRDTFVPQIPQEHSSRVQADRNQNLVLKLRQLEMRTTLRGNRSKCPDSSQLETAAAGSHIKKLSHVGVATRTDAAFLNNNC